MLNSHGARLPLEPRERAHLDARRTAERLGRGEPWHQTAARELAAYVAALRKHYEPNSES